MEMREKYAFFFIGIALWEYDGLFTRSTNINPED